MINMHVCTLCTKSSNVFVKNHQNESIKMDLRMLQKKGPLHATRMILLGKSSYSGNTVETLSEFYRHGYTITVTNQLLR